MKIYFKNTLNKKEQSDLLNNLDGFTTTTDEKEGFKSDILISYPFKLNNDYLDQFNNLKVIHLLTSGYDNLDLNYLKKRNIELYNAKDIYSIPIAEYVLANVLAYNKKIIELQHNQNERLWNQIKFEDLANKTAGIIGAGDIGREIAKRFKAFDVKVLGYKRKYEEIKYFDQIFVDEKGLDYLLKNSDYIIIALNLNKETHHFIDKNKLNKMKRDTILINIARGDVINQDDLYYALNNNLIRHAIIDVTSPEPLPKNNPLWTLSNITITPHISNSSYLTDLRLKNLLIKTLNNIINNKKSNNQII